MKRRQPKSANAGADPEQSSALPAQQAYPPAEPAPTLSPANAPPPASGPGSVKYQRILDAAVEVIAENGYFNSPVSAIAARAGVADGTIYLYFKSKDDVLRTAIDTNFGRFYRLVEERFKTLTDPRQQLQFIACLHLSSSQHNRSMAIMMQTEMRQSARFISEFSHHHLKHYIQVVREVIRRGQQQGSFRADVSDAVVAHCMFGAIDELLGSALFTGKSYDPDATAAQVIDILLNGVGPARDARAVGNKLATANVGRIEAS